MAYDPWGKRRNTNGLGDPLDQLWAQTTDRGYTQHEHLDEVGVIHMNGRIYDPLIGRFMSADPFIQAIDNLQSHNRYAYVMNNPLAYTDPSGYFWSFIAKIAVAIIGPKVGEKLGLWDKKTTAVIQGLAVGSLTGQWGTALTGSAIAEGAMGGAAGALVQSRGDIHATLIGGLSGGMFGWAGGYSGIQQYAAHAVAGCVTSVVSDGKCGHGASAALFGKYITNHAAGWGGGSGAIGWVITRGLQLPWPVVWEVKSLGGSLPTGFDSGLWVFV